MKGICRVLLFGGTLLLAAAVSAQTCPAVGASANCGIDITINPGGSLTITPVAGIQPIDALLHTGAGDDVLVGVINNSGVTIASLTLTGTGSPNNAFGFDGDGLCSGYGPPNGAPSPAGCPFNANPGAGYGGPGTFFSNINQVNFATGTINFTSGLANGAQAYFSLEQAPTSGSSTPTPEPTSIGLLGSVFLVMRLGRQAHRALRPRK